MAQQGIDVDAPVGQQPINLLDRVLGHPPARQCQTLADHADRQRCGLDRAERGLGQRLHPFGMQVVAKQRVEEVVDTVKRKVADASPWHGSQRGMTWSWKRASTGRGSMPPAAISIRAVFAATLWPFSGCPTLNPM